MHKHPVMILETEYMYIRIIQNDWISDADITHFCNCRCGVCEGRLSICSVITGKRFQLWYWGGLYKF